MTDETKTKHWTHSSKSDFTYNLALDFFTQLQDRLESSPLLRKDFAKSLGRSRGRISQIFNDPPSNPKLESLVKYAQALGLKVSVVAYDDGDPDNEKGPVFSGIFSSCWERAGRPRDYSYLDIPTVQSYSGSISQHPYRTKALNIPELEAPPESRQSPLRQTVEATRSVNTLNEEFYEQRERERKTA